MFTLDINAMVDYNGVTLELLTPMSPPFSAGIDAFSQCYVDEKNYYACPPYCLIPAVISFVIEKKINCTLIFPQFVPTPSWFPVVLRYAYIVTVGFLGDRGIGLFPSRKGYQVDKRGLQFNMLTASLSFSEERKKSYDPDRFMSIKPEYFSLVLLIGDSIVRFLEGFRSQVCVISLGGARINDVFDILKNELDRLSTFVVIIHIGTNDVNKVYKPVKDQLIWAKKGLRYLFQNIKQLQVYHGFAVVFFVDVCIRNPLLSMSVLMS
jgi:hypothetical protein